MNSIALSLITFSFILAGTILGFYLSRALPEHHVSEESKDSIKMAWGIVATMLDQDGSFFKRFGVPRGKTVILIYDKTGKLRDAEANLDDQETTLHQIKVITHRLLEE